MSGTTITSANNPYTVSSTTTITATTGNGVTASYAANFNPDLVNLGVIVADSVNNTGVYLRAATTLSGAAYGAVVTNGASNNSTALISGSLYGIDIESGGGSSSAKSVVSISNFGTIENSANSTQAFSSAVVLGFGVSGTVNNESTGVIIGTRGFGVYEKSIGGAPDAIINAGIIDSQAGNASAWINQADAGTGTIINSGILQHGVGLFDVTTGTLVNSGTLGQLGGSGANSTLSAQDNQVGVLNLLPGQSLDGGVASFGTGSTLELGGSVGQTGLLANPGSYIGFTSLSVGAGADWTVNGSISGISNITNDGTLTFTGNQGLGQVNMGGNNANTVFGFTGTTTGTELVNFGTTDKIIPTFGALPAGDGVSLSYANGTLSVTETNASGASIASENITVAVTTGDVAAFVPLYGTNGVSIELASSPAATNFTFTGGGTNTSFENPANFVGGIAPGNNISPGENVTIAAGTASVSSGPVVDNGTIQVGTNFNDPTPITGLGTLIVDSGASATLAGGTTLGGIYNFGTLSVTGAGDISPVNMEGNGANSAFDFTGTTTGTQLTNFGTTDKIVPTFGSLAPGDGVSLSYANGTLSVTETNAAGASIASENVTVAVTTGDTPAFTPLYGTNGVTIELASSPAASDFIFNGAGGNTSFENPANFVGGFAPGNNIAPNMNVVIAAGTASIASGALVDNGAITDQSQFVDTGSFTGNGVLNVQSGAGATFTGGGTLGAITDAGTLNLAGTFAAPVALNGGAVTISGNFADSGSIAGPGILTVESGVTATLAPGSNFTAVNDFGTLNLLGGLTTPINLEGDNANSVADFIGSDVTTGTLSTPLINFGQTDQIILGGTNFHLDSPGDTLGYTYNTSTDQLVVTDSTSGTVVTLNVGLATGDVPASIDLSTTGGVLDILIHCFASGTRILTLGGEVPVEDIAVGDTVVTVRQGGPTTRKVVWTGQRSIDIPRHPEPELVRPVRIRAGAFGVGLPERDLRLSPHHAVYADGCLFEVLSLVNGVTILQEQNTRHVTYHHIELDGHDVVLAEGLPAESFLDTGNRDMFEGAPAMRLHADFRSPADAQFCVKMVREGAELDALRDRLNTRAQTLHAAA